MTKIILEKTGKLGISPKHGILFVQVVNSLTLNIQEIEIFATKFSDFVFETECVTQVSSHMKSSQITEMGKGKISRKYKEFENGT